MNTFTFIDLFAGIGGFRIALSSVGGQCLGFSEIDFEAINTYCCNFDESNNSNFGDIKKITDLPKHDFMTAGVPCQSWSIAGKNLGFDDDRGQLWNDTLFLLNKSRPKVFIFENVKGLSDPRNKEALIYILSRIEKAGYYAKFYVLNAYDYGVPQTRVRIYIVGFKEKKYLERFEIAEAKPGILQLRDILDDYNIKNSLTLNETKARWSLSCNEQGFNDYFLFNDLRNGDTTIHSWDIQETTEREKNICYLLLKNRRKSIYGSLDGNPLSLKHFQELDSTIQEEELEKLVSKSILKKVNYTYKIINDSSNISKDFKYVISLADNKQLNFDELKNNREIKKRKINIKEVLQELETYNIICCNEVRYDFKNSKISTGLNGVNRIFLPSCKIYPTLVASDTNDFITTENIEADTIEKYRRLFLDRVYNNNNFRRITKSEACRIQGFPDNFILPKTRAKWMKQIGNSVAVPVIKMLAKSVINTGVFDDAEYKTTNMISKTRITNITATQSVFSFG